MLYHHKFLSSLKNRGFMVNPYDPCVWYSGSGMMKVARGKVHKYLGMTVDFATSKIVKVTMLEYVDEVIGSWDNACSELDDGYKAVYLGARGLLLQHPIIYSRLMRMQ